VAWKDAVRTTVLASGMLLLGCSTLDASRTITLVPDDELTDRYVLELERAALHWNLNFGTDLRIAEAGESQQEVTVEYNDLICAYAAGRTEVTLPVKVYICPHHLFYDDGLPWGDGVSFDYANMFLLLLHELGHVLNIRRHGDDPESVMYGSASYYLTNGGTFSDEDRELFYDVNPNMEP
jgi:hypothetical protein